MSTEREARYAEAIWPSENGKFRNPHLRELEDEQVLRVMAVADEEQAELRAEVERLDAHYIDWQRALQDEYRKAAETWDRQRARMKAERDDNRARVEAAEARLDALVADLRGLAARIWLAGPPDGGTDVPSLLRGVEVVLDKHAGEQPVPQP